MRNFQASAVERRKYFDSVVESHPMEAGWAAEAIFFLIIEEVEGENVSLDAQVEISADGINWIPEGTVFSTITCSGHYFAKVNHFGNWLRVSGKINGNEARIKLSIHLHLKA